jgi:hypothetical protein
MAKQRTLNEIRQSKEYQRAVELSDQGGKYTVPIKGADPIPVKNPFVHSEVEKTVETIIEDLDGHIYDLIFQAVCDEMNEHYVFDSSEYLTESGLELFEDEWFEFYHENHGKIIHKLIQKLK